MGARPALILSSEKYKKKTGLAVCCPIASNIKGYPFEVVISGKKINGATLSDHLKNLDWKIRKAKFIEKAPKKALEQCIMKISALIIQAEFLYKKFEAPQAECGNDLILRSLKSPDLLSI